MIFQLPRCCTPTLLARIATMFATCAWSIQVLHSDNALNPSAYPVYQAMIDVAPEDAWAVGGILASILGAATQVTRLKGSLIEPLVFSSMSLFWVYVAAAAWYFYPILPPTGWPAVLTVTGLSIFSATSREHQRGPAA